MTLVTCPDCDGELSSTAKTCSGLLEERRILPKKHSAGS
jgi:hypothetical protein